MTNYIFPIKPVVKLNNGLYKHTQNSIENKKNVEVDWGFGEILDKELKNNT